MDGIAQDLRAITSRIAVTKGPIRNPLGFVVRCLRSGHLRQTQADVIFALCVIERANRSGRDPAQLFWFLIRNRARAFGIDSEWPAVRALLERESRTPADLLRIAAGAAEASPGVPASRGPTSLARRP